VRIPFFFSFFQFQNYSRFVVADIFVVVAKVPKEVTGSDATHYKISIANKEGMPPYGPPIPFPGIFEKGPQLRDFLFTKCLNPHKKKERDFLH
jgi:hypothetical protein